MRTVFSTRTVPVCLLLVLCISGCSRVALRDVASRVTVPVAAGAELRDCEVCPVMVVVPPGHFLMGSPAEEPGHELDEAVHAVTIPRSFGVGKFGVSFEEWDACVATQGCTDVADGGWGRGRRPVIHVSHDQAVGYVHWLAARTGKPYRLLAEAEWEYAARAGTLEMRYWGNVPSAACQYANVYDRSGLSALQLTAESFPCEDGFPFTAPVGSFKPNAFGLYDMLGNVLSWTGDCYQDDVATAPVDGSPWTKAECARYTRRGGSFHSLQTALRVAKRGKGAPGAQGDFLGFRVARDLP